ncbi:MAG: 50S ribosomal protein L29 [Prevotellaceae bacterium]|jgi:large subunit ribosomal protein L29|nr:50S ribosomal protein L29 [Prevotellaceae bacterium]
MKKAEIKELNTKDLKDRVQSEKAEYLKMKMDHVISPAVNTSNLRQVRRGIARMLTELRQREINEQKQ